MDKLEIREIDPVGRVVPDFKGSRRGTCRLDLSYPAMESLCKQYGLHQVTIMRAITPTDVAISREELHAAREELSRKLLDIPIAKSSSGKIGPTATISYLVAMMVEAIAVSKESMPPSLAALLCRQLCRSKPKLAVVDDDVEEAIKRAILAFKSDEPISTREAAKRLGFSQKVMRRLLRAGFEQKVRRARTMIAEFEEFRKTCAL